MVDFVSKEKRSKIMRGVKSKNTKPEMLVRSMLHAQGYRFRLHRKDLPGNPDICLPKHKTIIFVHGCFWHHHQACKEGRIPESNNTFWKEKIHKNMERDQRAISALIDLGWKVIVLWECEIKDSKSLISRLREIEH